MPDSHQSSYKWYLLALTAVTGALVAAIPFSCMPALFKEIAEDLSLSLVQIGTVWGLASLAGISPGSPFIFWAALSVIALVTLMMSRETGRRRTGGD